MLWTILGITISYLIGSIPTGYIFGRVLKGIDIRKLGSGNVGATNVLRSLGKRAALAVLVLDMLKGLVVVVWVAGEAASRIPSVDSQVLRVLFGISSICGHNWTLFLKFKGGKGVATTFGVMLGLAIEIASLRLIFALLILTWLSMFFISRIVSLASVVTALMLPIYMMVFKQSGKLILSGVIISLFIILRHRPNLQRLLHGKEPRVHFNS
jgi:glycerol-3-phosphate acyltransferase PlsY